MTPTFIPVFLNGRPARVSPGTTLSALLAQEDPVLAVAFRDGRAIASDGRGVPATADLVLPAGAIVRVVLSARAEASDA